MGGEVKTLPFFTLLKELIKIYWVFAYNQNDIDRRMIKWLDFVPFKFKFFAKRFAKKHDFYECYYKEKGQKYGKEVVL